MFCRHPNLTSVVRESWREAAGEGRMGAMTRQTFAAGIGLAATLFTLSALAAPPAIGYAQATGYFKKNSRPTLYQPLHMLDAREVTAWCSTTSDHLEDVLTFGFKGVAEIDEIRIYTGNGFDADTFQNFNRARKLALKTGTGGRTFSINDQRGLQVVVLNPPLRGADFTLEVLDVFPAEDPDSPVCISDVVFYSNGKPLNGSWLTSKLKYDRGRAPLLGTWFGGYEGAPDQFLSFYFDGSYRFVFHPFDPQVKGRSYSGSYEASSRRVTLQVPKAGKASGRVDVERGEGAATLQLEGAQLPEELKQQFRAKP